MRRPTDQFGGDRGGGGRYAPCSSGPNHLTGFRMIRSLTVKNFRCFEALRVENCKRLNVLVGDNGGGKTAFLEAIFLALGTSAEVATRFRGYRGVDHSFNAAPPRIEEAMWGGIFRNHNFAKPVVIELDGDGLDNRTLIITRAGPEPSCRCKPMILKEELLDPSHLPGRMHLELFTLPYQPSWQAPLRAPERICRTFTISLRTKPMAQSNRLAVSRRLVRPSEQKTL